MSEHVTVKEVSGGNPWKDLVYYDIVFDRSGHDFECSWGKKSEGAPKVGDELEGEFFEKDGGEWGFRLSKGKGGSFSQPSSGSKDDVSVARMARAHAQEMGLIAAELSDTILFVQMQGEGIQLSPDLKRLIKLFEDDVTEAGQGAIAGQAHSSEEKHDVAHSPVQQSPPAEPPADLEHKRLVGLLERGAMAPIAAVELADWILNRSEWSDRSIKEAEFLLMEEQERSQCIKRLVLAYEKGTGELLPSDADDVEF